jgi:hypothetical protein
LDSAQHPLPTFPTTLAITFFLELEHEQDRVKSTSAGLEINIDISSSRNGSGIKCAGPADVAESIVQ